MKWNYPNIPIRFKMRKDIKKASRQYGKLSNLIKPNCMKNCLRIEENANVRGLKGQKNA
jgi:hypothetical protein